jgi:aspartate aminotransferase-like enzyme
MKLLTPGPVQVPKRVLDAMARAIQFHRSEEFRQIFRDVIEKLRKLYDATPIIIPGTGTLAVDVAVYNYVDPGDNVIVITNGEFGERLAESVASRGATVHRVEWSYDSAPPPDVIEDAIRRVGNVKAIALVHNETSTGATNRFIERYQEVAEAYGATLIVDSVSVFPVETSKKRVDVLATASHKALLSPPGASIVYISKPPTAKASVPPSTNLRKFLEKLEKWETPYTPPISIIYALNASLDYILELGLEHYQRIHAERAEYIYSNVKLKPVPREEFRSRTVAVFYADKAKEIVSELRKRGYVIAGGMWRLRDRTIRIGLMGDIAMEDLKIVAEVINSVCG